VSIPAQKEVYCATHHRNGCDGGSRIDKKQRTILCLLMIPFLHTHYLSQAFRFRFVCCGIWLHIWGSGAVRGTGFSGVSNHDQSHNTITRTIISGIGRKFVRYHSSRSQTIKQGTVTLATLLAIAHGKKGMKNAINFIKLWNDIGQFSCAVLFYMLRTSTYCQDAVSVESLLAPYCI
jgi:hypothetical protein